MKKVIISMLVVMLAACDSISESEALEIRISKACEDTTWLKEVIDTIEELEWRGRITQYRYRGETVFELMACLNCNDFPTSILTCDGTTICSYGGFSGSNTCTGFYAEATDKKLLWEN